jgi:hypothetical protein
MHEWKIEVKEPTAMADQTSLPTVAELWAVVRDQQKTLAELAAEVRTLKSDRQLSDHREVSEPPDPAGISRAGLLKVATAGAAGLAAVGILGTQVAGAETEKRAETCRNVRVTGPPPRSGIGVNVTSTHFDVGVYGTSGTGIGVQGWGAGSAVGGVFGSISGPQLHLDPGVSGVPTGIIGDFWVDANSGSLYYYNASGWVQLA